MICDFFNLNVAKLISNGFLSINTSYGNNKNWIVNYRILDKNEKKKVIIRYKRNGQLQTLFFKMRICNRLVWAVKSSDNLSSFCVSSCCRTMRICTQNFQGKDVILTARIRKMGEGTVFSLFVSSHGGRGHIQARSQMGGVSQ